MNIAENYTTSSEKKDTTLGKRAKEGSHAVSFNVQNYISGIYNVVLQIDGVNVADEHLIIIH